MKKKIVLWGKNEEDKRIMVAVALREKENMLDLYTFDAETVTEQFAKDMMQKWRNDVEIPFPEGYKHQERELNMSEDLLPEGIQVERQDVAQRAQTEWHFIVLSSKLLEAYLEEWQELKDRVDRLEKFDSGLWEELKGYWGKIQTKAREKNLFREHVNILRKKTDALFSDMKKLRAAMDAEFRQKSKEHYEEFSDALQDLEGKINEGLNFNTIFEDLKKLQRKLKNARVTKDHRSKIWNRLDAAFKEVKARKFGTDPRKQRSPLERLQRRYNGLLNAIKKMEGSINRDKKDLQFQDKRVGDAAGQLEAQIRQAKIKMVEERINSKENKLQDMLKTKGELERRMEKEKKREAKREEEKRLEEAKKEAEAKIKKKMSQTAQEMKEKSEELVEVAKEIKQNKGTPQKGKQAKRAGSSSKEIVGEEVRKTLEALTKVMEDQIQGLPGETSSSSDEKKGSSISPEEE